MKYDLSILIPARNEMFLAQTVKDILKNIRGNTEILVWLDGEPANPEIEPNERITVVQSPVSVGQRAATNQLARLSKAKYVMKLDAHCALDEGFDVKLMEDMRDDWTILPTMRNLHAFDWVCIGNVPRTGRKYIEQVDLDREGKPLGCGNRIYQSPTPEKCDKCGGNMERLLMWIAKKSPQSNYFRFDKNLHFQYWGKLGNRERPKDLPPHLVETMSAQGSCFMLTRKKYWELEICDEGHGSWGQQGTEVACKTWLSGGRLITNTKTYYAHMFRTQGGDFGFPYPLSGADVSKAREYSKKLWLNDGWSKAKHNLEWLLNKFAPVPDWHTEDNKHTTKPKKGVIYYTDNRLDESMPKFADTVRKQILKGIKEKHIVSCSLKPLEFGKNIVLELERGYLTMAKQILTALEASDAEVIFFCEHDVLYHPSHFDFIPDKKDVYYYNKNVWRIRASDKFALWTDDLQQLSGLVGYRDTLIDHYKKRVQLLEYELSDDKEGFKQYVRRMGFEPGTHSRSERVDNLKAESYKSRYPNLDIRHENNLTPSRWRKDQYRNPKYTKGWKESHLSQIDGWLYFMGAENGEITST